MYSINKELFYLAIVHKYGAIKHHLNGTSRSKSIDRQVRRYRIRIKKFIYAYSGKIIKIYQRFGILPHDSLGFGEPYLTKKLTLSLKVINIYNIFSFKTRVILMKSPP